jgi:hypothetical protein
MIKLLGFTPDVDQTTPGAILDCQNLIPGLKAMKAARTPITAPQGALPAICKGMFLAVKLDGTVRTIAGTQVGLYEAASGSWTDVSRGGGYTGGIDSRWRFTQYGNVTIASNKADEMQGSLTGAFANVSASAPKAAIVESINNFVFAADTSEVTFGDSPNRWWCSALGDYTNWTPNIDTQSVTGQLLDTSGKITAMRRLGNNLVIYKDKAMYLGQYQGPPLVWTFPKLPGEIGAPGQEAVVNIETAHIFVGPDDFYMFDGSRPRSMNAPLREWFFSRLNNQFAFRIIGTHDRANSLVRFYYPSQTGGGVIDSCVVYNYRSDKWGVNDITIEMAGEYATPALTYDQLGTLFGTYDDFPAIPYDAPFWTATTVVPAIFGTSHQIQTLSGSAGTAFFTTGDVGQDSVMTFVRRLRNRYADDPTSATLQTYYRDNLGGSVTADFLVTESRGKFDFMRNARWHRFMCSLVGEFEIYGFELDAETQGLEGE